jgi:hypothetical protein
MSTAHVRKVGVMNYQRRTLPLTADIRNAPNGFWELVDLYYFSDNMLSLLHPRYRPQFSLDSMGADGVTRRWLDDGSGISHFLRTEMLFVKLPDPDNPSLLTYRPTIRPEAAHPNYMVRSGTIYAKGRVAGVERYICTEEIMLNFNKENLRRDQASLVKEIGTLPDGFQVDSIGNPTLHAHATYEFKPDEEGYVPGEPPLHFRAPIIYAVSRATGPWEGVTNLILKHDIETGERELAVVKGMN